MGIKLLDSYEFALELKAPSLWEKSSPFWYEYLFKKGDRKNVRNLASFFNTQNIKLYECRLVNDHLFRQILRQYSSLSIMGLGENTDDVVSLFRDFFQANPEEKTKESRFKDQKIFDIFDITYYDYRMGCYGVPYRESNVPKFVLETKTNSSSPIHIAFPKLDEFKSCNPLFNVILE